MLHLLKYASAFTAAFCICLCAPSWAFAGDGAASPVKSSAPVEQSHAMQKSLVDMGYTQAQAEEVVSQLSEEEIAFFAQNPDALEKAGIMDPGGFTLIVVALFVWVFLSIVEGYDWP